jgi:outer membrane protein assembly factor BamB
MIGGAALLVGVAMAASYVPWAVAYGDRFPTGPLIVFYSPAVALGLWHALQFLVSRIRIDGRLAAATSAGSMLIGSVPALLSVAVFVSPNYLYEREMVTRRIVCLDAASGTREWQTDVFVTPPETKASANSDATPTPIVVGTTIVAAFGPAIAAVDSEGQLLWSKTIPGWIDNSIYGAGSSPTTDGEVLFVTVDREYNAEQQSQVIAYSLKTGDEIWSNAPEFAHDGYATPVAYDDGHQRLLLTLTSRTLAGYAIESGALAWKLDTPVSQPIPSLVAEDGRIYVTGGIGSGYTAAYQLRQNAAPEELWRSPERADVSSPVLYRGRLYTISATGIMVCHDAASGKVLWKHRVGSGLGAFYASLVAADGKVYAVRSNGTTYVVAAKDKFRLISESSLPEEIFASPAFAADCLFLRTASALYCIGSTAAQVALSRQVKGSSGR